MAKVQISIHAPREGSDGKHTGAFDGGAKISIHAPREGSDLEDSCKILHS